MDLCLKRRDRSASFDDLMNYLAHLWLTDATRLPLAGAILGDWVRGRLEDRDLPQALGSSIRLHRRVDAVTDRHPSIVALRERFPAGTRRYAGIVLDLVCDHALARGWQRFGGDEPLAGFARRAADEVAEAASWFQKLDAPPPSKWRLSELLLSYHTETGIDRALHRTAARLRQPQPLLDAGARWREIAVAVEHVLPELLDDLRRESLAFAGVLH